MQTIKINCSKNYNVYIGENILKNLPDFIDKIYSKIAVITDDNIDKFYSDICINSLKNTGIEVVKYIIPHGEKSKNIHNYAKILAFLAENDFDRKSALIALGGGVAGDLTGFAASTYMRGISFIQIPTSLLAMVDSSVGGKNAIDLPMGKNLAGTFYQPDFVLCDYKTLDTLPPEFLQDGFGEVIKYGIIADSELFERLKNPFESQREYVISRCVEIKRNIVNADEFESGLRQILNFGHTIAHGIEKLSGYSISHGSAVAKGIYAISKIACENKICYPETFLAIENILKIYKFDLTLPYTEEQIFDTIKNDKKRSGESINLIFPLEIGKCEIFTKNFDEIKKLLRF